MDRGELYWSVIDPIWQLVSIYDGPDVFLDAFAKLSEPQQHLFVSHWCQSEVRNGGFHQFFWNATGLVAPEAVIGFRAIGLPRCAELLEEAMAFFGSPYPRERELRQAALPEIEDDSESPFDELDTQFFEAIANDGFDRAADVFASRTAAS